MAKVKKMVAGGTLPFDATLGACPPNMVSTHVWQIAANAVMAGCEPCHFPLVLAAVQAMLDPR
jgi:hypothetical protein